MPKHIRIPCPECRRELRIRPEHVGLRVLCKHCTHMFAIPRYLVVTCPSCQTDGKVRTENIGRRINCKRCRSTLVARTPDWPPSPSLGQAIPLLGVSTADTRSSRTLAMEFEGEAELLRSELEARGVERASAIQQLGDARGELEPLQQRLLDVQEQLAEAQEQLRLNTAVIQVLEGEGSEPGRPLHRCEDSPADDERTSRLEAQLLESRAQTEKLLDELHHIELLRNQQQPLEEQLYESRLDCARLEEELDRLRGALAPGPDQPGQILSLTEELEALRQERDALLDDRERLAEFREQLRRDAALIQVFESERAELEGLHERHDALQARADESHRLAEELEALRAEADGLREALRKAEARRGESGYNLEALTASRIERDRMAEELQALRKVEEMGRFGRLHAELEETRVELGAAQADAERLRAELEHVDAAGRDQLVIREQFEAATHECARLREERNSLQSALGSSAEQAVRLGRLAEELEAARGERDRVDSERQSLCAERGQLQERLSEFVRREDELRQLRAAMAILREENIAAHDAEFESLRELDAARAECGQLRGELSVVRAELVTGAAEAERLARVAAKMEAALAERDRIKVAHQDKTAEADRLRSALAELERALAEAKADRESADERSARALGEAQTSWEEERRSLRTRWDQEHQARLDEAGARLREARKHAAAERGTLEERLEADRRQFEEDCQALQREIERHGLELESLRRERDESDAALQELDRLHQSKADGLLRALAEANRKANDSEYRHSELVEQVRLLQVERDHERGELVAARRQHEEQLRALAGELAVARADAHAGRQRVLTSAPRNPGDPKGGPAETLERLNAADARGDRLEKELQAARKQIDDLCRDLALLQWGPNEENQPTPSHSSRSEDQEQALHQVEELNQQLSRAQTEITQLRAILDYLGVHDAAHG